MSRPARASAGRGVIALALSAQVYSERASEGLPSLALRADAARKAWHRLL